MNDTAGESCEGRNGWLAERFLNERNGQAASVSESHTKRCCEASKEPLRLQELPETSVLCSRSAILDQRFATEDRNVVSASLAIATKSVPSETTDISLQTRLSSLSPDALNQDHRSLCPL